VNKKMKNKIKMFLMGLIAIFGITVFAFAPKSASAIEIPPPPPSGDSVNVIFENTPLFNEANFLPGQEVIRWVEVKNKSGQSLPIGAQAINFSTCSGGNCLADKLNLVIKNESSNELYNDSLASFFAAGEKKIADLAAGLTEKYYFSITFLPDSGNNYQNSTIGFDLKVGALGAELIGNEITPGGGDGAGPGTVGGGSTENGGSGANGTFIPDLQITEEHAATPAALTATITWQTNHNATSRVIYSSESEPRILDLNNLPNYGYAHSTIEYDSPADTNGTMVHSVTITGLTPGIYYYRCISHGSFAVSIEHNFTVTGSTTTQQELEENENPAAEVASMPGAGPTTNNGAHQEQEGATGGAVLTPETEGQPASWASEDANLAETNNNKPGNFNNLLAGLASLLRIENLWLILSIAAIILAILFWLFWRGKKKKEKEQGIR